MSIKISGISFSNGDENKIVNITEPKISVNELQTRFYNENYFVVEEENGKVIEVNKLESGKTYYIGKKENIPNLSLNDELFFVSDYKFDTKNLGNGVMISSIEYIESERLHMASVKEEPYPLRLIPFPKFTKRNDENIKLYFKKLDEGYKQVSVLIKDADKKNPDAFIFHVIYEIRKFVFSI